MSKGKILDNWGVVKHFTYKIQKGDTPSSVADKLEITLYELRHYHNFNCIKDADVINAYFPSHLQFLLLKPTKQESDGEQENSKPIKVIFDNEFKIPFDNVRGKNTYMVLQTIENDKHLQTIKYKASVECITKDKNGYSLFEIDRLSKVYLNNAQTDTITDTLAEEVSSVLYPLRIVINQEGKWIDIYNFDDIGERWIVKRKKILKKNEGETINKYLNAVDSILNDVENLHQNLSDDWFLKVFFNGIHTAYTSELSFIAETDFAITPKDDALIFKVTQKIDEYLNDINMVVIEKKGTLANTSKETTLEKNNFSGNYHSVYHLNPHTYKIESASLECDIIGNLTKKATVKIYNLNDKKVIASEQNHDFFVGETIKKESFFKDLFKLH
ncbi:peptidoglycan-binding protein LysM [Flavobacterium sp.]|uniref:peptidoglycan-binding protein LysM n=1 Tax=Flavobacterium sp. TaxID=239 RepID=UPI00374D6E08